MNNKERRKFGAHLTSIDIFEEHILPKIENTLDNYIWVDLYCGEGNLILPILKKIPLEKRNSFFEKNIFLFDVQKDMVEKAINNPLLDVDVSNATGALVNVIGGPNMSLDEYKTIIGAVGDKLSPDAKLIGGAQIADDMDKSIRVLLIVTGVKSSQILGSTDTLDNIRRKEIEEELGIEFFEN